MGNIMPRVGTETTSLAFSPSELCISPHRLPQCHHYTNAYLSMQLLALEVNADYYTSNAKCNNRQLEYVLWRRLRYQFVCASQLGVPTFGTRDSWVHCPLLMRSEGGVGSDAVAESVAHWSQEREIMISNQWSSRTNDLSNWYLSLPLGEGKDWLTQCQDNVTE